MRFTSIPFVLCCLLAGGVQLCAAADAGVGDMTQAAPSAARTALEQMSQAERKNSYISVEFETSDSEAVLLGREVERLWNGGQYDKALVQLGDLEARVGHVAIGNSWRKPVPTRETSLWGNDIRIGNRDSLQGISFDVDGSSGNLFVVLRCSSTPPHFAVCMSADRGGTWEETFTWSGSPPTAVAAAVLANHLYVVYNSPGDDPQHIRLRRFLCSNGVADSFNGGGTSVVSCTLAVTDTMKEVALVSNPNNNRLYIVALVSDGSVSVSYDDANAVSWTQRPTGITSGARSGLDATENQWSDSANLFFSYHDASDTLRVYGGSEQPLSLPAGSGAATSISAYLDTVICAYEDGTSSPRRVRYLFSSDRGDTWTTGTLSDISVAAEMPAVTVLGGGAAVFRHESQAPELRFCQRTDSGPWSEPDTIADHAPSSNRPGIAYLGAGVFGVVYLSNASPVVRGAFFDRSDWVYGVAEHRAALASVRAPLASVVRGVLFLGDCPRTGTVPKTVLLDITGRKVLNLRPGANDVSRFSPGVYFVRSEPSAVSRQPSAVAKVVVTR